MDPVLSLLCQLQAEIFYMYGATLFSILVNEYIPCDFLLPCKIKKRKKYARYYLLGYPEKQSTAVPVVAMLNTADFSYAGHGALAGRPDMQSWGSGQQLGYEVFPLLLLNNV